MNNIKEKIEEIFEEAVDKPGKFARFVFDKNYAVFFKNDGTRYKIQECILAIRKGDQPMAVRRIKPKEDDLQMMGVIRKNKYIAYMEVVGDEERENLFEVHRKDRASDSSVFFAFLHTDHGSVFILCDNNHEDMLYTELMEISTEPSCYRAFVEILKATMNVSKKEEHENEPEA